MKETPDANYEIEIRRLQGEVDPEVWEHLRDGYVVTLNHYISFVVVSYLPSPLDPLQYRNELKPVETRDEAAWTVLSTNTLVVSRSSNGGEYVRELRYPGPPDRCTVFYLTPAHFEALVTDIELNLSVRRGRWQRLDEIGTGALHDLLLHHISTAQALTDHERALLCLPKAAE